MALCCLKSLEAWEPASGARCFQLLTASAGIYIIYIYICKSLPPSDCASPSEPAGPPWPDIAPSQTKKRQPAQLASSSGSSPCQPGAPPKPNEEKTSTGSSGSPKPVKEEPWASSITATHLQPELMAGSSPFWSTFLSDRLFFLPAWGTPETK